MLTTTPTKDKVMRNYIRTESLHPGKIEIIEWFLGLSEVQTKGYRLNTRLKSYVSSGLLEEVGEHYELAEKWVVRYVFSSSKSAKIPATLRALGGVLDRPTSPAEGAGWKFPSHTATRMAVSYLGSYGIVAERYALHIAEVRYRTQP